MITGLVKKIIGGVVLLIVVVLVLVWLLIDQFAATGIEQGATWALKVKTTVDGADISLFGGTLDIDGIAIDNPEGYTMPRMIEAKHWELGLKTSSLFTDTVVIGKFNLNGLDLYIEENDKTNNISQVMDNIKTQSKEEEKPGGKKLRIDKIVITDITAHVKLRLQAEPVIVQVAKIELENVGSEDGVPTSEVIRQLFPAIIVAVINQGGGVLGPGLANTLTKDVTSLVGTMGGDAQKMVGQLGGVGKKVSEDAGKMIEGAGKMIENVGKDAKDAFKGLGDLLPGEKD